MYEEKYGNDYFNDLFENDSDGVKNTTNGNVQNKNDKKSHIRCGTVDKWRLPMWTL